MARREIMPSLWDGKPATLAGWCARLLSCLRAIIQRLDDLDESGQEYATAQLAEGEVAVKGDVLFVSNGRCWRAVATDATKPANAYAKEVDFGRRIVKLGFRGPGANLRITDASPAGITLFLGRSPGMVTTTDPAADANYRSGELRQFIGFLHGERGSDLRALADFSPGPPEPL